MLHNKLISKLINKEEQDALRYLTDIVCHNHEQDSGFDLIFFFDAVNNPYFENEYIKKSLFISKTGNFEKTESEKIIWYDHRNLTKKKKKVRGAIKLVEIDCFFSNFFKSVRIDILMVGKLTMR